MKNKKVLIIIIVLLILCITASVIGYYYSINKTDNNKGETNTTVDSELKEHFNKVGKNYDNIYTLENTELNDFNFDEETEKLFMDNFIIENLEYSNFNDSNKNQDLISNWLFAYIVNDQNINEACFSKDLLTTAYEKIFARNNIEIKKLFNENEMTNNYVCYSKKTSDVKEYKNKEVKKIYSTNAESTEDSYYEIIDNSSNTYNVSVNANKNINSVYKFDNYQENMKLVDIIKDREFDKQTEVGEISTDSSWSTVNYLKDNGSYDLENGVNITLNNGTLTFKQENKTATVPVNKVTEITITGEGMTQRGNYEIYFLNSLGEVYYYDEAPYDGDNKTLEERVKNYKRVKLDKKAKNFVFRRNEYSEKSESYNVLDILLKLEDNTLYSIENNKVVDYLLSSNNVTIYKNNDIEKNNKKLNYKIKSILDMEYFAIEGYIDYFVTEDDYLYDITNNKLVNNNKIDKIYKSNEEDCDYSYLVTFKNNESIIIGSYRCA